MKELEELLNRQHAEWIMRMMYIRIRLRRGVGPWRV